MSTPSPAPAVGGAEPTPAPGAPLSRAELDSRFAEAWVNRSHRVCGLRLPPYSLQSLLLLEVVHSPFVGEPEGRVIRWSDVWLFVAICRTPWRGEVRIPSGLRIALWAWVHRACRALRLHRLTGGLLGRTLATEAARVRAYQCDYATSPEVLTEGEGRTLTAPAALQRSVFLQRELGKPAREVEMQGLGYTLWEYAATLEQISDGVELVDEDGTTFFDDIEAIQRGEKPMPADIAAALEQAIAEARAADDALATPPPLDPSVFGN